MRSSTGIITRPSKAVASNPMAAQPMTLTTSVPSGNSPAGRCTHWDTRYRNTEPAAPPQAMAISLVSISLRAGYDLVGYLLDEAFDFVVGLAALGGGAD